MINNTEITVLGFKKSSDSFWTSSGKPGNISYQDYSDFISQGKQSLPQSIAIHGHSTDGGTLENKTPAEIAKELWEKYKNNQNQLKQICLLACEVSQSQNNKPSFAQSLANELYIKGFNEVIIYAPPLVEKDHTSRMLLTEGFGMTDFISYYVVPNTKIHEFDNAKHHSEWRDKRQIYCTKFGFPNSFISKTHKYSVSEALLIKNNIDDFFSKAWKGLYDFFSNVGSFIQIENQQIKLKYQELTQSYKTLLDNEEQRKEFQNSAVGTYKFTTSFKSFNKSGFLNTDWTQQYSTADGELQFPKIQQVELFSKQIDKGKTEVDLKEKKIKAKDVYDFMQTYKESISDYVTKLSQFNEELKKLKSILLEKVNDYLEKNQDISYAKQEVMSALKNYLQETDPQKIKLRQQELTKTLNERPGWAEGLISKRVRTAVESASQIIETEELAHKR